MPVQSDLQKAIAAAQAAKGTYAMFAQSTDDQTAKQIYTQMSQDVDEHINQLQTRLSATSATTTTESAQSNRTTSSQAGTQSNTNYSSSDMFNQE